MYVCMYIHTHTYMLLKIIMYYVSISSESYRKLSVMIVGDPMTGKTSLIKGPHKKGSKSKYSSNIIIHNLIYSPSANNKSVTFRIWDFPGQVCT